MDEGLIGKCKAKEGSVVLDWEQSQRLPVRAEQDTQVENTLAMSGPSPVSLFRPKTLCICTNFYFCFLRVAQTSLWLFLTASWQSDCLSTSLLQMLYYQFKSKIFSNLSWIIKSQPGLARMFHCHSKQFMNTMEFHILNCQH